MLTVLVPGREVNDLPVGQLCFRLRWEHGDCCRRLGENESSYSEWTSSTGCSLFLTSWPEGRPSVTFRQLVEAKFVYIHENMENLNHCMSFEQAKLTVNAHKHNLLNSFCNNGCFVDNSSKPVGITMRDQPLLLSCAMGIRVDRLRVWPCRCRQIEGGVLFYTACKSV